MYTLVGIDIGGTKCSVVLGEGVRSYVKEEDTPGGEMVIVDKTVFPTDTNRDPDYTLGKIAEHIDVLLDKNNLSVGKLQAVGISCGGPLDLERGVIMSPPNLPGWDNVPVVQYFEERLGLKTRLQNDANASALAEWWFGAAKGCSNVIFLTFGTGFGAGLILNGRLYAGTSGMAGEVGHIRMEAFGPVGYGKAGALEGFCSGGGIAQLARMKVLEKLQRGERVSFCPGMDRLHELDAITVAEAAQAGDATAREIYMISGLYLGKALAFLIDMLNPQMIVIGSIFARSYDLLWPSAEKVIHTESLIHSCKVCRIVPAGLGEDLGYYAALAAALYE